jgi:hypothetical protein
LQISSDYLLFGVNRVKKIEPSQSGGSIEVTEYYQGTPYAPDNSC